eukprot:2430291-Ditylum_brightwellii.AAC.1
MIVPEDQWWNFCYIMPDPPGHPLCIVVPSAFQMGWQQSPGAGGAREYFIPEGELELADVISEIIEVCDNDFILAAQPNSLDHLCCITRAATMAILSVFPPTKQSGHTNGQEPISLKKALKGDIKWAVHKIILGFLFDGKAGTIFPPSADKLQVTLEAVHTLLQQTRATPAQYCCFLGKIHHPAAINPAGLGLFMPLNGA